MCGIAGFWGAGIDAREVASRMADCLHHRGPDDGDAWVDKELGLALAHRRLAILDLSPGGHQPMASHGGRYVIVFNGEIYNHLELRAALGACEWRGHSDTETLLAACERWGVAKALDRCVGMFAFALWDKEQRRLTLARDRLGEKPLYYGWHGGVLLFGSELKALRAHPAFDPRLDPNALTLFLRHGNVPGAFSIYQGIQKLLPGTYWQSDGTESGSKIHVYWSAKEVAERGQRNLFTGDVPEAVDKLESLLNASLAGQMMADVPLGAFLSGGIDSSTVVALMQARSGLPIKTFTIGFGERSHNEAAYAQAVAAHLGTEHVALHIDPATALSVIPLLPTLYDEPFADPSQIPTYLVAKLARQHVTVALSGDGGDELFGGYHHYFWVSRIWRKLGWMPQSLRMALAGVLTTFPVRSWDDLSVVMKPFLPSRMRYADTGEKLHKLADLLAAKSPEEIYCGMMSHWRGQAPVSGAVSQAKAEPAWPALGDLTHRMMYMDSVSYLPNDILTKVDRAAMGVSLETRVPLLDHRVFEFAWQLPLSLKVRDGKGKWLLRQLLYKHVPIELIERPKMGFGIPLKNWLRGPLRDWAETLIEPGRLTQENNLDGAVVTQKWREFQSGQRDWSSQLWDVLMFQAWHEHYIGQR